MPQALNYNIICNNLFTNKNFSFSRFGDGEWFCIFKALGIKKITTNCNTDKHNYFTDLGKRLASVVKNEPLYFFGMQTLALSIMNDTIIHFIKGLKLKIVNGDILHTASIKGRLQLFFDSLSNRKVLLVGNDSLLQLKKVQAKLVTIPRYNCWQKYEQIKSTLKNNRGIN